MMLELGVLYKRKQHVNEHDPKTTASWYQSALRGIQAHKLECPVTSHASPSLAAM